MKRHRIEFAGALYHVTQRGNNRERIFRDDADKLHFLEELETSKLRFDFNLYGYTFLDNHYHLLMQTWDDPLHKIMHRVNFMHSRYFNRRYNRSDHLYGDRYGAELIRDERRLWAVLRYIHWNPVRAGLCREVTGYRWSSDADYRNNRVGLVDIDFILDSLAKSRTDALKLYVRLMSVQDDAEFEQTRSGGHGSLKEMILTKEQPVKKRPPRKTLDEILLQTGIADSEFHLIKRGSRNRNLKPYKQAYVETAQKNGYTLKEIGSNINLSDAAVYKLLTVN